MKTAKFTFVLAVLLLATSPVLLFAQSKLDCQLCHSTQQNLWLSSRHADTQNDVAEELAAEWVGLPPDSVILGSEAENCIACHGPLAVTANNGMTEVEALTHFFSTTNGLITDSTRALDAENWPHVVCTSCHNVPDNHPASMPTLSLFNSTTAQYDSVANSSFLCGQCHGSLRFPDTDHRTQDAWLLSKHGHGGQDDVAAELAEEWAGAAPDSVINGSEAENCIACHASTSVLANGGMTESQALEHFFSTSGGVFTADTAPINTGAWPEVACISCHNPHQPGAVSYFNSTTGEYEEMASTQELCGQCHGNLRFPDTDHLSYNILTGTGGMGVPDMVTMPGNQCVDCHMHVSEAEGSNSSMFGGHTWSVFVDEPDGSVTAACSRCHTDMDANAAKQKVEDWQADFENLDATAQVKVAMADSALAGSADSLQIRYLEEAKHNLEYAESDESGGFHNHKYAMALLNDAIEKSDMIVTGIHDEVPDGMVAEFALYQNYPNPFNPATTIKFHIQKAGHYTLSVYNVRGQKVATVLDKDLQSRDYTIRYDASNLATGVYTYELSGAGFRQVKKFILMK